MRYPWLGLVLALVLALVLVKGLEVSAQTLTLTTEDYPPFNIVDARTGVVTGVAAEKVQELMRRAGESYTIAPFPWSRAFQMGQKIPNTCVFSTTRTPERESLFKWVGPLVNNRWVVFARLGDARKPKVLEDLRPFVLGGYRSDAVADYLKLHGFKVEVAHSDGDNPRKLLAGRFDFWTTGELSGWTILKSQGLQDQFVQLFAFNQIGLYLACQKEMAQERIDRFNDILKEMERDGAVAAIEKKYK